MQFGNPQFLFLLFLLIPLVFLLIWANKKRKLLAQKFIHSPLISRLTNPLLWKKRQSKRTLWLIALTLLIFSLSQPQLGFKWEDLTQEGVDIMVVLDVSKSMLASDIKPNRLERAKYKVIDLLRMLDGDRIGIVAFAGTSFLQCPLTLDYQAAEIFLNSLDTDLIPLQGTAIGHAIQTAVKGFSQIEKKSRSIILITDGEDHEGTALKSVELAKKEQVRIFVIGIGQPTGAPIPDLDSGSGFIKDSQGEVILSKINETTLQQIALKTGGTYVRSVMGNMDLEKIYLEDIKHKVEKKALKSSRRKRWIHRFQWLLGLALILLMSEQAIRERPAK